MTDRELAVRMHELVGELDRLATQARALGLVITLWKSDGPYPDWLLDRPINIRIVKMIDL